MAGVCLDSMNPSGRPSYTRLKNLGVSSVRLEIRESAEFNKYARSLAPFQRYFLYGPSTEDLISPLQYMLVNSRDVVILGNEPDGTGDSSWTMTQQEYISFWNTNAPRVRALWPSVKLCAAGMVNGPDFLLGVWNDLYPAPDLVNVHYPNTVQEIQAFWQFAYTIVGEWCYYTGTAQEVKDWYNIIAANTQDSLYFCWSNGQVQNMGLTSASGAPNGTYYHYRDAIRG